MHTSNFVLPILHINGSWTKQEHQNCFIVEHVNRPIFNEYVSQTHYIKLQVILWITDQHNEVNRSA